MIIEKDIAQLAVGSYVVKIIKQTGNASLKHAGFVRDFHAIEYLIHQGVKRVAVDTSRHLSEEEPTQEAADTASDQGSESEANSEREANVKPSPSADQKHKALNQEPDKEQVTSTENPHQLHSEFSREELIENFFEAKELFDEAKAVQTKVLEDIKQGRAIDGESVIDMTNKTIENIFSNSDALSCVINIRHKDEYLLEHSISVSVIMTIFAKYLEMDRQTISDLAVGAFMHDVGKINVPMPILNKPGKLTEAEFEVIKSHVVHSANIVNETVGLSQLSREVVANHHEKLNGKGYPKGISGDEISRYSRMITICDIYDALTAERVYKKGISQIRAFNILREIAAKGELDVKLVDQFIKCMGVYPVGSLVKLTSNKLAIVEKVNHEQPIKPIVRAFFSLSQNTFIETKDIDLAEDENQQIAQGVRADEFDLDMNKITEFLMMQG